MAKFTTQELMAAHNVARNNAEQTTAKAAADATVPEIVDPFRKAVPFPYTEHPFGNNDNNRRVAERLERERSKVDSSAKKAAPLTSGEAALLDLKAAAEHEAANADDDSDERELSEEEQEAASKAALAASIEQLPVGKPKAPADAPTWKKNA